MPDDYLHNEKELFTKIAEGDAPAFKIIFEKYTRELLPFVEKLTDSREVAREVIQDIFLQVWRQRANLIQVENPKAWLVRLASNTSINYLRKKAAEGRLFDRLKTAAHFVSDTENIVAAKEIETMVQKAVLLP